MGVAELRIGSDPGGRGSLAVPHAFRPWAKTDFDRVVASHRAVLIVSQDEPRNAWWRRAAGTVWRTIAFGRGGAIDLPEFGGRLPIPDVAVDTTLS